MLTQIARVLDVDPALLTDGADSDVLDQLKNAAALIGAEVEISRTEEFAARYPGWSKLITAQARRIAALQSQVQALSDRISFDPQLAQSLHDVISAVTAIRSAAAILVGPEALDTDWQRRFHQNIHDDSLRLATSSEALVTYLEAPDEPSDAAATPVEQVEAYLTQTDFHLAGIEEGAAPDEVIRAAQLPEVAAAVFARYVTQYASDAALLPLPEVEAAVAQHGYDPEKLAHSFNAPLPPVLRRLATLPQARGHPPIGFVLGDAAGALLLLKTVPGFAMPRAGGACPLWPVFTALSRPEQPVRLDAAMPAQAGGVLRCYAIASARPATRFDMPPVVQSMMLVIPDPPAPLAEPLPVGVSCHICPRRACDSRREPAIIGLSV